ncbi:AMP-binding protein [Rhodococcus hoagii]|uniref:acyl-CoA synthetase n=1 Tax=Rhodococcus hoagii TaxID=43767 RepID=UPI0007CD516D|nr:acyl-CoA synthetase [Prescottella equi]MBM4558182.1 AMP-binding protein [Prescottella equi]NKR79390.1 AMP-binding protein [Prescottella equi]NKS39353.1 AMP-binding protein [Prescottella equi]NKW48341.1 AMP-binding protein [Prescottella equi]NKZ72377.1 AMP-binding protein [Prescottella equi]
MQDVLTKITDTLSAVRVMQRSGLIPFPRVDEGVRVLLAVDKYGPFAGSVHAHAAAGHGRIALIDERGALTYRELEAQSNALARAWKTEGIGVGTCVGAMCRNHRGLILTMLAAAKSGVRLVLMNTGFARPQLVDVAVREKVEFFVFDSEFADIADALPSDVATYLSWVDGPVRTPPAETPPRTLDDLIAGRSTDTVPAPEQPGVFILLTSGTTGTPKGAPRGHTSPFVTAQFLDRIPLRPKQTMLMAAPAFHGTGISQLGLGMALENTVVMQRRFDPETTVRLIAEHRADTLVLVPTMLQRIIDLGPDVLGKYDTSSLKVIFAAGSAIPPDLCIRTQEAFGKVLHNFYGSTEVAAVTVATPDDLERAPGTAGRPPATCHIALFDDAGKRITEPDVVGRIFAKSGLSFEGYTDGRDKERIDGMLSTGDVGHFDHDGLLFVDGRDDDMIVSGGENVYPLEVENLIAERPDVLEVAVIGVEDDEFGHRLRAFVVAASTSTRDPDEIRAHVKSNLARYKVPRDVVFIEELPRNATGKLLRRVLSEMDVESS